MRRLDLSEAYFVQNQSQKAAKYWRVCFLESAKCIIAAGIEPKRFHLLQLEGSNKIEGLY